MIIYIITQGDYSDYSIRKVFTDKTLAENYVEMLNKTNGYSNAEIEEWETEGEPEFIAYAVTYDYVYSYNRTKRSQGEYETNGEPTLTRSAPLTHLVTQMPQTLVTNRHKERPDVYVGIAYGKTYEHAEKNLWDAIAKAKAEAEAAGL